MVKITEYETRNIAIMHCLKCDAIKCIKTYDAKSAYMEINKFRGEHEHLERRGDMEK